MVNRLDPRVHLSRLRELASAGESPRGMAACMGEFWALPIKDAEAHRWTLQAMETSRLGGRRAQRLSPNTISLQVRIDEETLPTYRRLRETFHELDLYTTVSTLGESPKNVPSAAVKVYRAGLYKRRALAPSRPRTVGVVKSASTVAFTRPATPASPVMSAR